VENGYVYVSKDNDTIGDFVPFFTEAMLMRGKGKHG